MRGIETGHSKETDGPYDCFHIAAHICRTHSVADAEGAEQRPFSLYSSVSSPIGSGKTTGWNGGCKFKSEKMKFAPSSYYSDMLPIGYETLTGQY